MQGSITITILSDSVVQAKGELDIPDFTDRLRVLDVMVRALGLELPDLILYLSMYGDLRQAVKFIDCSKIDNLDDVEIDWTEFYKQIREGDIDAESEKE